MEQSTEEVLNNKKRILLKNKEHILKMPNTKKRVELLQAYYGLLDFYSYGQTNDVYGDFDVDDVSGKYNRYVFFNTVKSITELSNNVDVLQDKYQKIIDIYNNNGFYAYEYVKYHKINPNKLAEATWNFFATLGDDVLKIYYDMLSGGNILLSPRTWDSRLGFSIDTSLIDNASMVLLDIGQYLEYYITLAHEIGHCYQFYLQKNQKNFSFLDPYAEINSLLFQLMFVDYLKNNYIIKDDSNIQLSNQISFFNEVSISKLVCKMFKNKNFKVINPFGLKYQANIPDEELKREIENECGHLGLINKDVEIDQIMYSLGRAIALNFKEKLENTFDVEWKNYKNFLCEVQYLSLEEVIKKYFDVDIVEDNIKTFIKSYRNR